MDKDRKAEILSQEGGAGSQVSISEPLIPPQLFHHKDLKQILKRSHPIDQGALANLLNYIHFMDGYVFVHLRHLKYKNSILAKAYPEPCLGKKLTCSWSDETLPGLHPENYELLHLYIDDGHSMILVPAVIQEINSKRFTVELPDTSYSVYQREARRYVCRDIGVELIQDGFLAGGRLLDFSPIGFRIRLRPLRSDSFDLFDLDELVTVCFRSNEQIVFSGNCQCIRIQRDKPDKEIVLVPVDKEDNTLERRKSRNPRQQLAPSPTIIFDHPFIRERIRLSVSDISSSGFSAKEMAKEAVLIPGMSIPELTIDFPGAIGIKCAAQVVSRLNENEKDVLCDFVITDMDIKSYSRLNYILTNAQDPNAFISSQVDLDALWEFFFDTGFIYPKKYSLIQSNRKKVKGTYRKLYQESPEIAGHFTYQKNGRIYGHISMVRAYEKAWMIHHHAAKVMDSRRAGFLVLKQIMRYLNDMHRLPSTNMAYSMSFFRKESKFPNRVFGGFARYLKNPRGCSMDLFSYLSYPTLSLEIPLPKGWVLQECSRSDLWELSQFYDHHSGGLLLDLMNLRKRNSSDENMEKLFEKLGFMRRWKAYSLIHDEELNAVLIVDQSDPGLNLSELLNGIKILVVNTESLPWDILSTAIGLLTSFYHQGKVPVLIYPMDYVKAKGIPREEQYQWWILNVRYGDDYMEFMRKKFRISNN